MSSGIERLHAALPKLDRAGERIGNGKVQRGRVAAAIRWIPAVLAIALLVIQLALPWSATHLATEDGASHVYGGVVFWNLVFHHKTSLYAHYYTLQRLPLPNWTSTVLLGILSAAFGPAHAEQAFFTLAMLIGFVAWCYAARSLAPEENPCSPVANFLYATWFLWLGFCNFYLGMALVPAAIGIYAATGGRLRARRAVLLSATLLAIYFTHLIAVAAALATVLTVAIWVHALAPLARRERVRFGQLGLVLLSCLPSIALIAWFALQSTGQPNFDSRIAWAWSTFPKHIFLTARHEAQQFLLWNAILIYAAAAVLLLRKREWGGVRGGMVAAAAVLFFVYLLVPDNGLGGTEAKIRFSWAFFVVAGLVTTLASRLRWLRLPMAIFIGWLVWVNAGATRRTTQAVSRAASDYLAIAGQIPPGASFVRVQYPIPRLAARFDFEGIGRQPLYHLNAQVAAEKGAIDIGDYEAASRMFPVVYKPYVDRGEQSVAWSFEGPDENAVKELKWIEENFPAPVQWILLTGDEASPEARQKNMGAMLEYLNRTRRLAAQSADGWFRLYRTR